MISNVGLLVSNWLCYHLLSFIDVELLVGSWFCRVGEVDAESAESAICFFGLLDTDADVTL